MELDFPSSPTNGQVYTGGTGLSWVWDGVKWVTGTGGFSLPMMVASSTMTLPAGFNGFVRVENGTNAPITITLPPAPAAAQAVTVKDCYGNAAVHPITITGEGPSIEGHVSLPISFNYGWVNLIFTGSQWVQA